MILTSSPVYKYNECEKCGKKLDPSKEIPLCNECERVHD